MATDQPAAAPCSMATSTAEAPFIRLRVVLNDAESMSSSQSQKMMAAAVRMDCWAVRAMLLSRGTAS